MPESPKCPECRVDVQPSWDWCMACGFDPEGLKSNGWIAPNASASVAAGTTLAAPRRVVPATKVEDARPQQISDLDWVQAEAPRRRLSYVATAGVLAAILVAVAGLVFVIVMVLNQPVGSTRADALSLHPPSATLSVPASTASR